MTYAEWIAQWTPQQMVASCASRSQEMARVFPELKAVAGYICFLGGGKAEHWWCVDPQGNVIDPTADQFRVMLRPPIIGYEPYDRAKHGPMRVGKCMNCGDAIYDDNPRFKGHGNPGICSDECEEDFGRGLECDRQQEVSR